MQTPRCSRRPSRTVSLPKFLNVPVSATPVFAILALLLFAVFLLLFTLSALREKLPGKMNVLFSRPTLGSFVAWAGLLSWLILTAVYLVMRMWLGRSVEDINMQIVNLRTGAPQLHAEVSNGFTSTFFCPHQLFPLLTR